MKTIRSTIEEKTKHLQGCPLFTGVDEEDLAALAEAVTARAYDRDEILFIGNTPAEGFHIILAGKVKVCRYGTDGREQILHLVIPGAPVGEVPVFQGKGYPATAVALEKTETLYLPRAGFMDVGKAHPDLLLKMLGVLSGRLRHFVELVDDLSLKEVSTRLARYLLQLSEKNGGAARFSLDTTKSMLANRIGTIAETMSRTLARMQRRAIIEVKGKEIVILNRDELEELSEGEKL